MLIGSLFGINFAANAYQSNKKAVDNYVKSGIEKAKAEISAGASGLLFDGISPVAFTGMEAAANETVKATPAPHQFTPDLKVFGSPEYVKRVNDGLEELKKTPDSFRINGMTAYQYATYYLDELYEGDKEKIIEDGKEQYPIKYIYQLPT